MKNQIRAIKGLLTTNYRTPKLTRTTSGMGMGTGLGGKLIYGRFEKALKKKKLI